ncbi:hypothetical protein Q1695_015458 [Nippostrongylus brasiliensis]|nr:hypothetical protein Q1695_015458 [Nippostrongylus brasiliensis]
MRSDVSATPTALYGCHVKFDWLSGQPDVAIRSCVAAQRRPNIKSQAMQGRRAEQRNLLGVLSLQLVLCRQQKALKG